MFMMTLKLKSLCYINNIIFQNFLSEHARPYSDSIYDEMVAEQESRRKADQRAEEENQRKRELQEEALRNTMQEEVERLMMFYIL